MMGRLEDLDASELRAELDEARDLAMRMFDKLLAAVDEGDLVYIAAVACAAKPAVGRVKAIRRAMQLGVAS
jgi:hypothetical protein